VAKKYFAVCLRGAGIQDPQPQPQARLILLFQEPDKIHLCRITDFDHV